MSKKRKDPINNNDIVVAHTLDGKIFNWKLGNLKKAYISNNVPYEIVFLYFPKKNKNYYVSYNPTKGFKYTEVTYEEIKSIKDQMKRRKNK